MLFLSSQQAATGGVGHFPDKKVPGSRIAAGSGQTRSQVCAVEIHGNIGHVVGQVAKDFLLSDLGVLILLALAKIFLNALTNSQYGFHRDELATLDDARRLAWGYVAYPPLTPAVGRLALALFGTSLPGFRFFASVASGLTMVLAGLMARELGGKRLAQVVTAVAVGTGGVAFATGALFQYVAFDFLWWVLIAYLVVKLLKSENPRWWLAIGAAAGLGLQTKYTIGFYLIGLTVGLLLTGNRRYLAGRWLWGGVGLALLIFLPNVLWQIQHGLIALRFLSTIHARDVAIGRASGFLVDQVLICINPFMLPLAVAGLYYYFRSVAGRRYRMLGWMWVVPFLLFWAAQGRGYYMAPAYPLLLAPGAVLFEGWVAHMSPRAARGWRAAIYAGLAGGVLFGIAFVLPVWPINSAPFRVAAGVDSDLVEEIGWPELVQTVADIYAGLPAETRAQTAIITSNYGEAGAVDLYGPAYGLPRAISGVNSYWLAGYSDPPPQMLIVIGFPRDYADREFTGCHVAGHVTNRYGVRNEESRTPDIFLCGAPRRPWPQFWQSFQHFG
jgi:4-amino-4-deoxy-L-arabinose transferase-like glycosyltransferase